MPSHALTLYSPTDRVDLTLVRLDRAMCKLHAGHPDAALTAGREAIHDLPSDHRSDILVHRARQIGAAVSTKYGEIASLKDFYEALAYSIKSPAVPRPSRSDLAWAAPSRKATSSALRTSPRMELRRPPDPPLPRRRPRHRPRPAPRGLAQVGLRPGDGVYYDHDFFRMEDIYLRNDGEFLVGELDDRIVAMGGLRRADLIPGGHARAFGGYAPGAPTLDAAEMVRLRVLPTLQRRGYGAALVRALEQRAAEYGYRILRADTTEPTSPALALYRKLGWTETRREPIGGIVNIYLQNPSANKPPRRRCSLGSWRRGLVVPSRAAGRCSGAVGPVRSGFGVGAVRVGGRHA